MVATTELAESATPEIEVDVSSSGFFQRFNLSGSGISHTVLGTALAELPGCPVLRASEEPDVFEAYPRSPQDKLNKIFGALGVVGTYTEEALALFQRESDLSSA